MAQGLEACTPRPKAICLASCRLQEHDAALCIFLRVLQLDPTPVGQKGWGANPRSHTKCFASCQEHEAALRFFLRALQLVPTPVGREGWGVNP